MAQALSAHLALAGKPVITTYHCKVLIFSQIYLKISAILLHCCLVLLKCLFPCWHQRGVDNLSTLRRTQACMFLFGLKLALHFHRPCCNTYLQLQDTFKKKRNSSAMLACNIVLNTHTTRLVWLLAERIFLSLGDCTSPHGWMQGFVSLCCTVMYIAHGCTS